MIRPILASAEYVGNGTTIRLQRLLAENVPASALLEAWAASTKAAMPYHDIGKWCLRVACAPIGRLVRRGIEFVAPAGLSANPEHKPAPDIQA